MKMRARRIRPKMVVRNIWDFWRDKTLQTRIAQLQLTESALESMIVSLTEARTFNLHMLNALNK